jgi:hypothetical protein
MQANFVFHIRSLSLSEGFEVDCDGILEHPLRIERLFTAVAVAAQLGRDSGGEIHIFDVSGDVVEVLPLPNFACQQPLKKLAA